MPTAQFTHFIYELASSTSQSLLGAAPPNPCFRSFTNVLYTIVYQFILFFQGIPLKILLPVSFKISPSSSNLVNNSVSYPQNNLSSTPSSCYNPGQPFHFLPTSSFSDHVPSHLTHHLTHHLTYHLTHHLTHHLIHHLTSHLVSDPKYWLPIVRQIRTPSLLSYVMDLSSDSY